ncbi:GNAT family N-acetyltransferase [Algoriphagus sp. H41]|uniref:GNAT family N-acetyltransferase n=1 Tax=Algoriphagus oliviformis TaxID=2811231 RepID=A0ABS3C4U5_9BACT|nr:GNAT family N-acetyltransferase [Algoriphagus oliviformis]MBN7812138.1 GNAT family N-acetyltransferase [Algoriphagus oliviformis]
MSTLKIVSYTPELKPYFASINKAWVSRYFSLEPFDIAQLDSPEETILDKGGVILFAVLGEEVVGTVGLMPMEGNACEMIKMGVDPAAQGRGVGMALGQALIAQARQMGFAEMVLYSNSILDSALRLYEKMGFARVEMDCGAYERCNVKMERKL